MKADREHNVDESDDGTSLVEIDSMEEERKDNNIVGGGGGDGTFLVGFDSMEVDIVAGDGGDGGGGGVEERIWIDDDLNHPKLDDDQIFSVDVSDQASTFYNMDFQPLIADDFPCMSSSSSSSSTPVPANPPVITVSSSSAASWTIMMPEEVDQDLLHAAAEIQIGIHFGAVPRIGGTLSSAAPMEDDSFFNFDDCMNDYNMENSQSPDLMDDVPNQFSDPSSNFQVEMSGGEEENRTYLPPPSPPPPAPLNQTNELENAVKPVEERLSQVFYDWLKANSKYIAGIEDLRNITLNKSTIDSASNKLGNTKAGKIKLLKLILEWVAEHKIKRVKTPRQPIMAAAAGGTSVPHLTRQTLQPFSSSPWTQPQQPYATYTPDPYNLLSPPAMATDQYQQQQTWQMPAAPVTDQYQQQQTWQMPAVPVTDQYQQQQTWQMPAAPVTDQYQQQQTWQGAAPGQVAPENNASVEVNLGGYGGNPQVYPYYPGSSKEARQRRMAKLRRRMFSHQYNIQPNRHINVHRNLPMTQIPNPVPNVAPTNTVPANWPVYMQGQNYHQQQQMRQQVSERRLQGWKHEKNLKFLFQKILQQSDVRLGRIVLPKKEAEKSLPELETRGIGISIPMEDFGSSRVWYLRYRFWPNHRSRMYVLENAGEFLRTHRLEEGDIIVVYSDKKREKYMIRAVKVRPFEGKPEVKKKATTRSSKNRRSASAAAETKIYLI